MIVQAAVWQRSFVLISLLYPKEEKMPDLEDEAISIQEESAVPEEEPVAEERESRFGPLKFGAGYDLKRDR